LYWPRASGAYMRKFRRLNQDPVVLAADVRIHTQVPSCSARVSVDMIDRQCSISVFWEEGIIVCAFEHSMAMYASH
jgi:hypothetical protein